MPSMNIRVLFMQRKESYPGEFGPEVLAAIDEFALEENPDYWAERVEREKAELLDAATGFAEVVVRIDLDEVRRRCLGLTPPLSGEIVDAE